MPARFQVKITRSAEQDIEDIWTFIASDNEDAATKFVGELERQAARLARFPERCALIPENELLGARYRHLVYGAYRTVFRIEGRIVYVLRIVHGARLLDTSMFELDR